MAYIKKGGWGGSRKGKRPVSKDAKLFYELHFKQRPQNWWHPQVNWHGAICPICENDNGEFITELRPAFYKCEKCGHHWDADLK